MEREKKRARKRDGEFQLRQLIGYTSWRRKTRKRRRRKERGEREREKSSKKRFCSFSKSSKEVSPAVQEAIPNPEMEGWAEDDVEERGEGDSSVLFHFMNRNLDQTKPKRKKKKKK